MRILTCGTYDLFHLGHLNQLKRASNLDGELVKEDLQDNQSQLVVGVSSDFLNLIKKKHLPVVPLYQRVQIVESIRCINTVFVEEEYDTNSKKDYSILYNTSVFTIGDDWKGHFDDLVNQGNISRVMYLSRTAYLSTSQMVNVLGRHIEFNMLELKPDLNKWKPKSDLRVLVILGENPESIRDVLAFLPLFQSDRVFWYKNTPLVQDINLVSKKGKRFNEEEIDLIIGDETESTHQEFSTLKQQLSSRGRIIPLLLTIQREDSRYRLKLHLRNTTENLILCPEFILTISTEAKELWLINQRLAEQKIVRQNILVKLNQENLSQFRDKIVDLCEKYNLIIIPDPKEKGIADPKSTLNFIFWNTVRAQTAQYLTILPTNYYIYEPNLYHNCDILISDSYDQLAYILIPNIYDTDKLLTIPLKSQPMPFSDVLKATAENFIGQTNTPVRQSTSTFFSEAEKELDLICNWLEKLLPYTN